MSLITRCPACETLFRVVPDQLRVSGGWVRCGRCGTVFDASLHLLQAVPEFLSEPPDSEPRPEFEDRLAAGAWAEPAPEPASAPAPEPVLPLSAPTAESQTFELPTASFLRSTASRSPPRTPGMTALWVLLSLLLLLGFLGQLVMQQRDRLAAWQPGVQSALEALCLPLNCHLSPLRRIEAIVIDSSSFNKAPGAFYRLNLTLKNTAGIALAVPAIELTLTDAMDQAVVRRVFLPAELGALTGTLAAGQAWSLSLALAVSPGESVDAMLGYRLLAFYP
jgi:predicted Zn finger-like uncharacterized protein